MNIETIISSLTLLLGACGFTVAYLEYKRQGHYRQMETLLAWRTSFEALARKHELLEKLTNDHPSLATIPLTDKAEIIGLLEGIAIALETRQLDEQQVYNFFGFYTCRLKESAHFMEGIEQQSIYWKRFFNFADRMACLESKHLNEPLRIDQ
jgi:hypothetical protein